MVSPRPERAGRSPYPALATGVIAMTVVNGAIYLGHLTAAQAGVVGFLVGWFAAIVLRAWRAKTAAPEAR